MNRNGQYVTMKSGESVIYLLSESSHQRHRKISVNSAKLAENCASSKIFSSQQLKIAEKPIMLWRKPAGGGNSWPAESASKAN